MKLPGIASLVADTGKTFLRFPFATLCAVVASVFALLLIDWPSEDKDGIHQLTKGIMTLYLGMLTGISCTVFCERYSIKMRTQFIFNIVTLVIMHFYYYSLPHELTFKETTRFCLLSLSCHLGLAFAPFLVENEPNGFWQFNKTLFLRILTAGLYSVVLVMGLSGALLAIDELFDVNIDSDNYPRLYIIIFGIFNTLFFTEGIPSNTPALERRSEYPKGLKIFTQYVLLPLITVYLFILYAYTAQIIISRVWPSGWVAWLVIGFSTSGILSLLLVWPLRNDDEHQWIKTYSRYFFIALFPLLILLAVSIGKRVMQYGITENRYFIIILTAWLLIMTIYFLFSKIKNIKIIPLTLFVFSLLSAYGSWSAFEIAEHSQRNRLIELLAANQRMLNGKIIHNKKPISFEQRKEISSITEYLVNMHGLSSLQPYFAANLDSLCKPKDTANTYVFKPREILKNVGIEYINQYESSPDYSTRFYYSALEEKLFNVSGYDFSYDFTISENYHTKFLPDSFFAGEEKYTLTFDTLANVLIVLYGHKKCSIPMLPLLKQLHADYGDNKAAISSGTMVLNSQQDDIRFKVYLKNTNGYLKKDNEVFRVEYISGQLLIDN